MMGLVKLFLTPKELLDISTLHLEHGPKLSKPGMII